MEVVFQILFVSCWTAPVFHRHPRLIFSRPGTMPCMTMRRSPHVSNCHCLTLDTSTRFRFASLQRRHGDSFFVSTFAQTLPVRLSVRSSMRKLYNKKPTEGLPRQLNMIAFEWHRNPSLPTGILYFLAPFESSRMLAPDTRTRPFRPSYQATSPRDHDAQAFRSVVAQWS
jgi:hypothetical protein